MAADDVREYHDEPPVRRTNSSSCLLWVVGFGLVGVICCVLCCGGFAYFGFNLMSTEVEVAIRDNPQVREHLGDLQSVSLNLMKSVADNGDQTWVYNVKGSKGTGELTVVEINGPSGKKSFHSAKLRLADGRTIDVEIQPETDTVDQIKAEMDAVNGKESSDGVAKPSPTAEPESVPTTTETPSEPAKVE